MSSTLNFALMRGITAERNRLGWSQAELARRMGWERRTIMRTEAGDRELRAHELVDLCSVMNINLRQLLVAADSDELRTLGLD